MIGATGRMPAAGATAIKPAFLMPTSPGAVPFHQRRRQQFLLQAYADAQLAHRAQEIAQAEAALRAPGLSARSAWAHGSQLVNNQFERLSLLYTAGAAIESLRPAIESVVSACERARIAKRQVEQRAPVSPFRLELLGDYHRVLQIVALCYLLHRRDLLPRLAELVDVRYQARDALYEALLSFNGGLRANLDHGLHERPYAGLLSGLRSGLPSDAAAHFKRHVDGWYPHFEREPWHDSHLRMNGPVGAYVGYWAFEAGAAVLLRDCNDATIDHLVYPRELVAWARANSSLSDDDPLGLKRLRCLAGQPCPKEGVWFSPARADARQHFEAGAAMPELGGAYGTTIWQWDERT